jgi:hypothetical protein
MCVNRFILYLLLKVDEITSDGEIYPLVSGASKSKNRDRTSAGNAAVANGLFGSESASGSHDKYINPRNRIQLLDDTDTRQGEGM